jgi:hypothetical protein
MRLRLVKIATSLAEVSAGLVYLSCFPVSVVMQLGQFLKVFACRLMRPGKWIVAEHAEALRRRVQSPHMPLIKRYDPNSGKMLRASFPKCEMKRRILLSDHAEST